MDHQFDWHRKPTGDGALCSVCGCSQSRLKAEHRALRADEISHWNANRVSDRVWYLKLIKVCFGTDTAVEPIVETI